MTLYRGTKNKDEIKSIEESGKVLPGHIMSFSESRAVVYGFGNIIFQLSLGDCNVKLFNLQNFVSAYLQVLTDIGVGFIAKNHRSNRSKIDNADEKSYKSAIDKARNLSIKSVSHMYQDIVDWLKFKENNTIPSGNRPIYDVIHMGNEQEWLVPIDDNIIYKIINCTRDGIVIKNDNCVHIAVGTKEFVNQYKHSKYVQFDQTKDDYSIDIDTYLHYHNKGELTIPNKFKKDLISVEIPWGC